MACDRVKELLSQQERVFEVRNVDEDEAAYDELLALGFRSVPVTVIGSTAIAGFDREALVKALGDDG
jgi:glutaredoxin